MAMWCQCAVCIQWIHKRCIGVHGDLSMVADGFRCKQCDGTIQSNPPSGGLRCYGHVMRKVTRTCMEYIVERRKPVERPSRTWLESVEADMAELEIDREDVHDRRNRESML